MAVTDNYLSGSAGSLHPIAMQNQMGAAAGGSYAPPKTDPYSAIISHAQKYNADIVGKKQRNPGLLGGGGGAPIYGDAQSLPQGPQNPLAPPSNPKYPPPTRTPRLPPIRTAPPPPNPWDLPGEVPPQVPRPPGAPPPAAPPMAGGIAPETGGGLQYGTAPPNPWLQAPSAYSGPGPGAPGEATPLSPPGSGQAPGAPAPPAISPAPHFAAASASALTPTSNFNDVDRDGGGGADTGGGGSGGSSGTGAGTGGPPPPPNGNPGPLPPPDALNQPPQPPTTGHTGLPPGGPPPAKPASPQDALTRYSQVPGYGKLAQNPQWLASYYDFANRPGNEGVDVVDFLNDMYPGQFDTSQMPADAKPGRSGFDTWKFSAPGVLRGFGSGTVEGGSGGSPALGSGTPTDNGNGTLTTWHGATPPDTPQPSNQELMDLIKKLQGGQPGGGAPPPNPANGPPIGDAGHAPGPGQPPTGGGASGSGNYMDDILALFKAKLGGGAAPGPAVPGLQQGSVQPFLDKVQSQSLAANQQIQQQQLRALRAAGAADGSLNSGGFGDHQNQLMSQMAASQGADLSKTMLGAYNSESDRNLQQYLGNLGASTAANGQQNDLLGALAGFGGKRYSDDVGLQGQKYGADKQLEGSKYSSDKSLLAAQAAAQASRANASAGLQGTLAGQRQSDIESKRQFDAAMARLGIDARGQDYQLLQYILGQSSNFSPETLNGNLLNGNPFAGYDWLNGLVNKKP